MTLSEIVGDFALSLRYQDIPPDVEGLARLHTLDAIGVGVAASTGAVQRNMLNRLVQSGTTMRGCSVLGDSRQTAAATAALLNGTFIHALEYDDTHMASIVHGSSVLVPSALAAAEQNSLTLADLMRLIVIGWEVLIRVGLAAPGAFQRRGFQVTSVAGALVSALIASHASGATRDELVSAQGIAGSQASGIFEFLTEGSTVKSLHPGWAAHAGALAAQLASAGMTGPSTVYEGRFGLYNTYTDVQGAAGNLRGQFENMGEHWLLREAAFKLFPCCHYIHPFLECAQQLKLQWGSLLAVGSIECRVPAGAAAIICEPWERKQQPGALNEAKYSLPYCLALVFLDIPVTAEHFIDGKVDTQAVALARKISWTPLLHDNFPRQFEAEMSITLINGEKVSARVDQVKGSLQRPAATAEIRAKFLSNTKSIYSPEAQQRLICTLLDAAPDTQVADLSEDLRSCIG
ncbi:MAG: MmgE/PrpD family protein [Paralcaligenes sp.]